MSDPFTSAFTVSELVQTHTVSPAFPTRRELRAQQSKSSRRRPRRLSPEIAAPVYALPAAKKKSGKKRFSALITMTAVTGLFAAAGIPAYAIEPTDETNSTTLAFSTLAVSDAAKSNSIERETFSAIEAADLAAQRSNATRDANYTAYMASGARELGDDYPYFSELDNTQGGGLSPLNYYYRECVDFVAWRLNRDAGSTSAPFLMDWSYLTPTGGDARAWAYAWQSKGWDTGSKPVVGSVAWFNGNHVAYVAKVNNDGTVLIEEYNHGSKHLYGQRTIPATDVALFLYAPPLPGE